jgi:hypothetical protein
VSVIPVSDRAFLIRAARASTLALAILCVGTVIQIALMAILTTCYVVVMQVIDPMPLVVGLASNWASRMLMPVGAMAGLTGLMAGIYEMLFGQTNARVILVASSVVSFTPLILHMVTTGSVEVPRIILATQALILLWFVASMMASWTVIQMMRPKTPATEGLPPA